MEHFSNDVCTGCRSFFHLTSASFIFFFYLLDEEVFIFAYQHPHFYFLRQQKKYSGCFINKNKH